MAKLSLLLATFALVLFLANGSIYRTTITVDNDVEDCQQQIKKQDNLKHCQKYVEEKSSSSSSRRYNPSKHLDSCCEQLENLDRQCQCPGLKQAVKQQMQEGEFGREEMQKMYEVAEEIMEKCELQTRRCEMPSRSWF